MSNINHLGINENFPVPGQDNDTQVFRDNFDTIKTSLRIARDEITALEDTTAKLNQDNDFELNVIQNAVFQNNRIQKSDIGLVPVDGAQSNIITVDFKNGDYQIYRFRDNVVLDFLNFPGDGRITPSSNSLVGVGKVILELYGDGTERTIDFSLSGSGATEIKKAPGFPSTLTVTSNSEPVFIEVWRHTTQVFFARLISNFAELETPPVVVNSLNNIGDVSVSSPADDQILKFNASTNTWINSENILKVNINEDLADGQALVYSSIQDRWVNFDLNIDIPEIVNDFNVDNLSLSDGQILIYSAQTQKWINSNFPEASINVLSDVNFSNIADKDKIRYNIDTEQWENYNDSEVFTVKVVDNGSGTQEVFEIDGTLLKDLSNNTVDLVFEVGKTYRFDLSDSSNQPAPLRFSTTPDTAVPALITPYTNDVKIVGVAGQPNSYIEIEITDSTPSILYVYGEEQTPGLDTSNIGGSVPITVSKLRNYNGSGLVANNATVDLTKSVNYFSFNTPQTATLNAGFEGQIMSLISLGGPSGNMVITVPDAGWVLFDGSTLTTGFIRFEENNPGQSCTLQYVLGKWFCIGNNGAVFE